MNNIILLVGILIISLSYRPSIKVEQPPFNVDLPTQIVENYIDCTKLLLDIESEEFKEMQLVYTLAELALRETRIMESREVLSDVIVTAFHAKCTLSTLYTREEI